jgi:hypothetical protein
VSLNTTTRPRSLYTENDRLIGLIYSALRWVQYWLFFETPDAVRRLKKQLWLIQLKKAVGRWFQLTVRSKGVWGFAQERGTAPSTPNPIRCLMPPSYLIQHGSFVAP